MIGNRRNNVQRLTDGSHIAVDRRLRQRHGHHRRAEVYGQ